MLTIIQSCVHLLSSSGYFFLICSAASKDVDIVVHASSLLINIPVFSHNLSIPMNTNYVSCLRQPPCLNLCFNQNIRQQNLIKITLLIAGRGFFYFETILEKTNYYNSVNGSHQNSKTQVANSRSVYIICNFRFLLNVLM